LITWTEAYIGGGAALTGYCARANTQTVDVRSTYIDWTITNTNAHVLTINTANYEIGDLIIVKVNINVEKITSYISLVSPTNTIHIGFGQCFQPGTYTAFISIGANKRGYGHLTWR
jgi:hypothetical protein